MKTFVKKHALWAFALLLSVTTMSFKLAEKNAATTYSWFEVEPDGDIVGSASETPPAGCSGAGALCAVAFNPGDLTNGNPPINNVSQNTGQIQDEAREN